MHRDVKPENIILEGGKPGGKVFLVDFGGIQQGSKDVADSEVMDTGTLVGTYGYMAPEQLRGSAKPASDLFALGGTLLYLLSGSFISHCHHLSCVQCECGCSACTVHARLALPVHVLPLDILLSCSLAYHVCY